LDKQSCLFALECVNAIGTEVHAIFVHIPLLHRYDEGDHRQRVDNAEDRTLQEDRLEMKKIAWKVLKIHGGLRPG
jgi:hypothetical protein